MKYIIKWDGCYICYRSQSLFINSSTWEAKISESCLMTLNSELAEFAKFPQLLAVPLGLTLDFFFFFLSNALENFQSQGFCDVRYLLPRRLTTLAEVFRQSA